MVEREKMVVDCWVYSSNIEGFLVYQYSMFLWIKDPLEFKNK